MYCPRPFEETNPTSLHAVMRAHPFGLLVTSTAGGLDAHRLPFVHDAERGTLLAPAALASPALRDAADTESLVVFQGPTGYVSPGWYPSKAEGGRVVPTWNYLVVQARGRLRVIDDRIVIAIASLRGKWKLSQDDGRLDALGAARGLRAEAGRADLAVEIEHFMSR